MHTHLAHASSCSLWDGAVHTSWLPGHVSDLLLLCPKHLCSDFITSPTALAVGKMRMRKAKWQKLHHRTRAELTVCAPSLALCSLNQSSLFSPHCTVCLNSQGEVPDQSSASLVLVKLLSLYRTAGHLETKTSPLLWLPGAFTEHVLTCLRAEPQGCKTGRGIQTLRSHLPGENM